MKCIGRVWMKERCEVLVCIGIGMDSTVQLEDVGIERHRYPKREKADQESDTQE